MQVYKPYLLMNKKRYAGLLWTNPEKYDKMDTKVRSMLIRTGHLEALIHRGASLQNAALMMHLHSPHCMLLSNAGVHALWVGVWCTMAE